MAKKKKAETQESKVKQEEFESKSDIQGWRGGLDIDLDRKMSDGRVLRDVLSSHVKATLDLELQNQSKFVEKLAVWQRQYQGKKEPKDFPHPKAANLAVPITRIITDTIFSRIIGWLFGRRKVWIVSALKPEFVDLARQVEDALDDFQRNILHLRKKLISPLLQTVKMGAGIGKLVYEDKKKTVVRYATEQESDNPVIVKYGLAGTETKGIKSKISTYKGPNFYPVSLEDFIMSSDATEIEDAYMVGHRIYLRKPELEVKARQKVYDKDAVDKITGADRFDETKESRVENTGKELKKTTYEEPYELWELCLRYDVDEDGEEDDIVIVINRDGIIVRAIYNPIFDSFRPYVKFIGSPLEFSWRGEGTCEILEIMQEEADTIHNQRRDRQTILNAPPTFTRSGVGLDNFKLQPGRNYVVDDSPEDIIFVPKLSEAYPATEGEEDRVVGYAYKSCGISPEATGMPTSERPVAKETLARLEEANKKFKMMIDNVLIGVTELGYMLLEFFSQYQPTYTYTDKSGGQFTEKTVQFPTEYIRDIFEIKLEASSEIMSQEIRREVNLTIYTILSDYMTKIAGMAQAIESNMASSGFKQIILAADAIGSKLLTKVLEDFDQKDAADLVLSIGNVLGPQGIEQAMAISIDKQPPPPQEPKPMMGPQGGEQGGQQGQPPMMGQ